MDPFTHALMGATVAGALCRKSLPLKAAVAVGALAGMAPDLDVLIRSASYPLLGIKYHRMFTHAWAFAPVGALLCALVFAWVATRIKRPTRWQQLYLPCLIGYLCHPFLDALTNYGTHLFWPFTMRRESWSIISIVDPLFTIPLLVMLIVALVKQQRMVLQGMIVFMLCYWSLGYYQREAVTGYLQQLASTRGHLVERFEVKPSFGNLLLWRAQYAYQGRAYVDAVHHSPWAGFVLYAGGSVPLIAPDAPDFSALSAVQQQDVRDFDFFSDGWVSPLSYKEHYYGDVRFAMLPNQLQPLWAIETLPQTPDAHVNFFNIRERQPHDLEQLWAMICGDDLRAGNVAQ